MDEVAEGLRSPEEAILRDRVLIEQVPIAVFFAVGEGLHEGVRGFHQWQSLSY